MDGSLPPPPSADEAAKMAVESSAPPPPPSADDAAKLKVGESHTPGLFDKAEGFSAAGKDTIDTLKALGGAIKNLGETHLKNLAHPVDEASDEGRAIGGMALGLAAQLSGLASGSYKAVRDKTPFPATVQDEQERLTKALPDLTTGHPGAEAVQNAIGQILGAPMQILGDAAYDVTGSPLAGALGQAVGGALEPVHEAVKAKIKATGIAADKAANAAQVADQAHTVATTFGLPPDMATNISAKAAEHSTTAGRSGNVADHVDAAVNGLSTQQLRSSPRAAGLLDAGLSETEVKAALAARLREHAASVAPPVELPKGDVDKAARSIQSAFGTEGGPEGEAAPAEAPPVDTRVATPEEQSRLQFLNERLAKASPDVAKIFQKQKETLEKAIATRAKAAELREHADAARQAGLHDDAKTLNEQADKIDGGLKPVETPGIEVGEAEHIDDIPEPVTPPAPKVEPNPEPQAVPTAGLEVGEIAEHESEAVPTEGLQVGEVNPTEPPAKGFAVDPFGNTAGTPSESAIQARARPVARQKSLPGPEPQEALPAPSARPVTRLGQVAHTLADVPPNVDVGHSVGLAGGKTRNGKGIYISRVMPHLIEVADRTGKPVTVPVWEEIASHENAEFPHIKDIGYDKAHNEFGNAATAQFLEKYNVDPIVYGNALRPYVREAALDATRHPENVPKDLDHRVYAKPWADNDVSHLLGEQHPYNQTKQGAAHVAKRAADRARLLSHFEDQDHAPDDNPAERGPKDPGSGSPTNAEEKGQGQTENQKLGGDHVAPDGLDGNSARQDVARSGEPGGAADPTRAGEETTAAPSAGADGKSPDGSRAGAGENESLGDISFQRSDAPRKGMIPRGVESIAKIVTSAWKNAPRIQVHASIDADTVHPQVKAENAAQLSRGAKGAPVAWYHSGTIHLNASAMHSTRAVLQAIFHEGIAHHGLKGVFGDALKPMLEQLAENNKAAVEAKMAEYGMKDTPENRTKAAEEILARMAESNPKLTAVRGAVAAVRSWLRDNIPALRGMKFSDDELVRNFIAPARRWIESGEPGASAPGYRDPATGGIPNRALDPADNDPAFARGGLVAPSEEARDISWNMLRERLSKTARYIETADARISEARTTLDKLVGRDYQKVQDAYHEYETTGKSTTLPEANSIFKEIKKVNDQIHSAIVATGKPLGYIEHYLAHNYQKAPQATEWFKGYFEKNPLSKAGFTKERYYQTLRDAEAAGLKPVSKNIIDSMMQRWQQMKQYEQMHAFRGDLKARGWLEPDPKTFETPPGWGRINDPLFNGHLVPAQIAKDINNFLDTGIDHNKLWRTYRAVQGATTSLNLGFSAFHPLATTLDIVSSRSASVWQHALIKGALPIAMKEAAQLPSDFISAFSALANKGRGIEMGKAWRGVIQGDPITQIIMQQTERGGGRGHMTPIDTSGWKEGLRAWNQRDVKAGVYAGLKTLIDNTGPLIHHQIVPAQKWLAKDILIRLELNKRAAALGVQPGDYQNIVRLMSDDAQREIMGKAMDSVDDRLGQYTYVNRRIGKMLLTAMQAGLRSPGWFLGGASTMLRPIWDLHQTIKPQKLLTPLDKAGKITDATHGRLTNSQAFFVTMMSTYAMVNGGINAAIWHGTGEDGIKDWRDLFSIRMRDGSRFLPPGYAKEFFELTRSPIHRIESAASPTIGIAAQGLGALMATLGNTDSSLNRNYFGNMNVDPDADVQTQLNQFMTWAGSTELPFAFGSNSSAGQTPIEKALPFLGVPKAPKAITNTNFQDFVENRYMAHKAAGNLPPEKAADKQRLNDAVKNYKMDPSTDLSGFKQADREKIKQYAKGNIESYQFSQLTLKQQLEAFEKASPEEREKYKLRQVIENKYQSNAGRAEVKAMDPDDAAKIRDRVRASHQR